jgi:hypothetical protein
MAQISTVVMCGIKPGGNDFVHLDSLSLILPAPAPIITLLAKIVITYAWRDTMYNLKMVLPNTLALRTPPAPGEILRAVNVYPTCVRVVLRLMAHLPSAAEPQMMSANIHVGVRFTIRALPTPCHLATDNGLVCCGGASFSGGRRPTGSTRGEAHQHV